MKRPIIALAALAVIAAGSVGAFYAVKSRQNKKEQTAIEQAADLVLFSYDAETITKMSFDCTDGQYDVYYDGAQWVLDGGEFQLDQTYIQNVSTYAADLTAVTDYGAADDEKKAMYGLDHPETVTVTSGTEEKVISIGNISPTGDYYYIMVSGRDKIYAIDSLYGSVLRASRLMLKSKSLIPYDAWGMNRIVLTRNGETAYDLTYDEASDSWSLPEEYSKLTFDNTAVTSLNALMARLTAEEMLDEYLEDYSRYGFDKPAAEMTVYGKDGTSHTVLFSSNLTDSNNAYIYVLLKDSDQVEKFYRSDLDFINYTPLDFVVASAPVVSMANISGFEFSFGDITESYTVDIANLTGTKDGAALDLTDSTLNVPFQNFYNAISVLTYTDLDTDAQPELTDPVMSVLFHTTTEGDIQIDLTDAGGGRCYVFRNGEYTGALVDSTTLTGKNSVTTFHSAFAAELS